MMKIKCLPFYQLNLDEIYTSMALRQEVFVVEQDCPYLDADGKDQEAWHVMGWDEEGDLVAYTRLLPKGISYENYASIGRVISSSKVRGKGAGKEIMIASIEACKKLFPNQKVKISAQVYALTFYRNLGFEVVGEEYLEDDIPHMSMILQD
ncbi:MAG: ElaA protein [Granulosicoccus sp.]|jgi:ElaA protein